MYCAGGSIFERWEDQEEREGFGLRRIERRSGK
jgi:hypothetical protein